MLQILIKVKWKISYYDTSASVETKYANFLDMVFSAAQIPQ